MKKFIVVFCTLLVLLTVMTVTAFADTPNDNSFLITSENVNASAGNTVTVTLNIENNPGIKYLRMTVVNDEVLTLVNAQNGTVMDTMTSAENIEWNSNFLSTKTGVLATLVFEVSDNVIPGSYGITLTLRECFDDKSADVNVTINTGSIIISCSHKNTTNTDEIPATCKDVGYTAGVMCTDCNAYLSGHKVISQLTEHTWDNGVETKPASHTDPGVKTYTCEVCSATTPEVIDPLGHKFDQKVAESAYLASAATCEAAAVYHYSCSCGEKGTATFTYGAPQGHNYEDVVVLPNCTDGGYTDHTCTVCGDTYQDAKVDPNGHTEGSWIVDAEPKPGVPGEKHISCTVCNTLLRTEAIDALPEETEPETQPETDPETEPETDPETEPETEEVTESETDTETTPETQPETEEETDDESQTIAEAETYGSDMVEGFLDKLGLTMSQLILILVGALIAVAVILVIVHFVKKGRKYY